MSKDNSGLSRPAAQRLEAWMQEVTALLCYQPEIPLAHKTDMVNALLAFTKEIEFMDAQRQQAEREATKEAK